MIDQLRNVSPSVRINFRIATTPHGARHRLRPAHPQSPCLPPLTFSPAPARSLAPQLLLGVAGWGSHHVRFFNNS